MRRTAVVHVHFTDLWPEFITYIRNINPDDVLITTTDRDFRAVGLPTSLLGRTEIIRLQNRGRDIYPLVSLANADYFREPSVVWKLHTKKSSHTLRGHRWRKGLIQPIAGSSESADRTYELLASHSADLVGASRYVTPVMPNTYREHAAIYDKWMSLLGKSWSGGYNCVEGTMFATHSTHLHELKKLALSAVDFPLETGTKFNKVFVGKLILANSLARLGILHDWRASLDLQTRPNSPSTYAMEAFLGVLAGNVIGVD